MNDIRDRVRAFEVGDKDGVLRICERVWGKEARDFLALVWDWKHGDNDFAIDKAGQNSRVVLKGGSVVGFIGLIPVKFMMDGKPAQGRAVMDLYVDPDARSAGVSLMKKHLLEGGIFYGFAVPRATKIYERILKRDSLVLKIIEKRYLFLDSTRILSSRFPQPIVRVLASLWRLYTTARYRLRAPKMPSDCSIREISRFTLDIDAAWERFARGFRFSMTRDSTYLNWRFCSGSFPYQKRLLLRRDEIIGCIVYRKAIFNGEPVVFVCEAFATGENRFEYALMLGEVYRYARAIGAARIGTMNTGCMHFKAALDALGFLSRVHESMPVIGSWFDDTDKTGRIYDQAGWYFSPADADMEFALFDQMSILARDYAAGVTAPAD